MIPLLRPLNAGVTAAVAAFAHWLGGGAAGQAKPPKPPPIPQGFYWHVNYFPNKPPAQRARERAK